MYTLIENCRLHGVEPYAYLKDVLERLPTTTNQQFSSTRLFVALRATKSLNSF